MLEVAGTVFANAEPCAVAECVAPGPEFFQARDEVFANGVGNPVVFTQNSVELKGKAVHAVDPGP